MSDPLRRIESAQMSKVVQPEAPTMAFMKETAAALVQESRQQKARIEELEKENLFLKEQSKLVAEIPSEVQKKMEEK